MRSAAYCSDCQRDSNGRIARSRTVRRNFQRANPCPSTGGAIGACPGYVADHVIPLRRGGADSIENMRGQTIEEAKAKDREE
jgi:5-methylcytosine-specific restriction endonuclease McrA